jgi:PAS domain S-box-containing protein
MLAALRGPGPAALSGVVTGLVWWLVSGGLPVLPGVLGLTGYGVGLLAYQRYEGRFAAFLRQPFLGLAAGALLIAWPLHTLGYIISTPSALLDAIDRGVVVFPPLFAAYVVMAITGGLLVTLVLAAAAPQLRPQAKENLTPPWQRHLEQRVLWVGLPFLLGSIVVLVGVVTVTSYLLATQLVVTQIERDAENAGAGVPFFVQVGRGLLRSFEEDLTRDTDDLDAVLRDGLRAVPFFQQLIFVDVSGDIAAIYPAEVDILPPTLTDEERSRITTALSSGAPADFILPTYTPGEAGIMAFVEPVEDATGQTVGVLVGRAQLAANPILGPFAGLLVDGVVGEGAGFITDGSGMVILDPARPMQQGTAFTLGDVNPVVGSNRQGQAFRRVVEDGTRELVYILPIEGRSTWSVVMTVPNDVSIQLAGQIALPTLGVLLLITAVAVPLAAAAVRTVTRPLEGLLTSVEQIGRGALDDPIEPQGEAEIMRLSEGVEEMRSRLQRRLAEQDNLLKVTRAVASNLELFRAMPSIIGSALELTEADGVRVVLRSGHDTEFDTYAGGPLAQVMQVLDERIFERAEQEGMLVVSKLWRTSGLLDDLDVSTRLQALVAFPLRGDTAFHGVMWLGYQLEHRFDEAEMTFLSTLAGQTAVAVSNARLLAEAQERRRELEAVLASTVDGIIVTDVDGRVALLNPAAADFLDVRTDQVRGIHVKEVVDVDILANVLSDMQAPAEEFEIPGPEGHTLLVTCSTIVSDGSLAGRVGVLRDVTDIKELDSIKTVFLRMVSHDLRSPLTYMRGYITMMPLLGDLNAKQNESIDKIQTGIQHITQMTERLTHLSRLRFGETFELDYGMIDVLSTVNEVVDEQRSLAADNNVEVFIDVEEDLPLLLADPVLFRQAVLNLVGNAIKYSPDGGTVTVTARHITLNDQHAGVKVTVQDTGIGIREEDQEQLFKAFYRVPHREGDPNRPSGSGLGLALVKSIADAHGGHVDVESRFGQGSTFTIVMPLRTADEIDLIDV